MKGHHALLRPALLALTLVSGLASAAELVPDPPFECSNCDAWNEPQAPFRIYGNSYYVGTAGLASILVVGKDDDGEPALILLDGALPQSAPLIADNIETLGYRLDQLKVIMVSHAHFDHAGGIAALQRASGAKVYVSPANLEAFHTGQVPSYDPQFGYAPDNGFPPVPSAELLIPHSMVEDGHGLEIRSHRMPGHTVGSNGYSWRACEGDVCLDLVYADSMGAVSSPGFRFSAPMAPLDGRSTATLLRESTETLRTLDCDILLFPHPFYFDMHEKLAAWEANPDDNPFIDPTACATAADQFAAALDRRLAQEAEND